MSMPEQPFAVDSVTEHEMTFVYRSEIADAISKVETSSVACWWRFKYGGEIIDRQPDDLGSLYFQFGRTFGSEGGRFFLCTRSDSDMITLRLTAGI